MKHRMQLAPVLALGVALAGCGSNCNMLGSRMPAHCEAGLAAGAVIAAPVLIPVAIMEDQQARRAPPPQSRPKPTVKRPSDPYVRALYESGGVEFDQ